LVALRDTYAHNFLHAVGVAVCNNGMLAQAENPPRYWARKFWVY